MTLDEILLGGGLGAAAVLSLLEIAPIKVNPWRAIARGIGRALNGDVLDRLAQVQQAQQDTSSALEAHIKDYDEYKADEHRAAILAFNTSLLRGEMHTQEDFFDAFRHNFQPQNMSQTDNRFNNCDVFFGRINVFDKRTVDFQLVHRETAQIIQRRITCSEIIDCNSHAVVGQMC